MLKLWSGQLGMPVIITSREVFSMWSKIFKKVPIVYAAGGIVRRPDGKYLFIHRRGWWDLPKGKLDKGENNKQAALREVREEVGLTAKVFYALPDTYHCYSINEQLVLKVTAWYVMKTDQSKPVLQREEDIVACKWLRRHDFNKMKSKMYANLNVLIDSVRVD